MHILDALASFSTIYVAESALLIVVFLLQILNVLAPVQRARDDVTGAKQMFESATTLLKSIGDLPSLVTTLTGLYSLHEHDGDDLAGKSQRYMQRKADDWQARLEAIQGCNHHNELLKASGWLYKFAAGL